MTTSGMHHITLIRETFTYHVLVQFATDNGIIAIELLIRIMLTTLCVCLTRLSRSLASACIKQEIFAYAVMQLSKRDGTFLASRFSKRVIHL